MSWVSKLAKNIREEAPPHSPSTSPPTSPGREFGDWAPSTQKFSPITARSPLPTLSLSGVAASANANVTRTDANRLGGGNNGGDAVSPSDLRKPSHPDGKQLYGVAASTSSSSFARGLMSAAAGFAQSAASSASATLSKGASDCAPPPAAGASAVPESQRRATKFREFAKLGLTDPSRRKYSASTLKALFKKCLEARTEKERFELFGEVLQVYVGLFGDVATPKIISESMDDLRGMTKVLSKYFIYHTNRAVETMTKAEAGAELLRILRSTERLYNALKTIELLTAGPDYVFEVMEHNQLPSALVRIFYCFFHLPPNAEKQPTPLGRAPASTGKTPIKVPVLQTLLDTPIKDVPPSAVVISLLNIIKCLLRKRVTLKGLVTDDALFLLVMMVIKKPDQAMTPEQSRHRLVWKGRAVTLLTLMTQNQSFTSDPDTIVHLHVKQCMRVLVNACDEWLARGPSISSEGIEEILLICRITVELVKESSKKTTVLVGDFKEARGYDVYTRLLTTPMSGDHAFNAKRNIISMIETMVMSGCEELLPLASEGMPCQHADFTLPTALDETKGPKVRNLDAFRVLLAAALYPKQIPKPATSATVAEKVTAQVSQSPAEPASASLQHAVIGRILNLVEASPINYFLVERESPLFLMLEHIDSFQYDSQKVIMDLLHYVIVTLNYVPFKELSLLCHHLQGNVSSDTFCMICGTLTGLLDLSPKHKGMFRDVGFLKVVSIILQEVTAALADQTAARRRKTIPPRSSPGQLVVLGAELDAESAQIQLRPVLLQNFQALMQCLAHFIRDHREIASVFRKTSIVEVFTLLRYRQTRRGVLFVIEELIADGYKAARLEVAPSSAALQSPVSPGSRLSDFAKLIEILQSAPRLDLELKVDVLSFIKRIFLQYSETKSEFRTAGGYVCLISLLVSLEGTFEPDESSEALDTTRPTQQSADSAESGAALISEHESTEAKARDSRADMRSTACQLLRIMFAVLAESFSHYAANRLFFESHIGYRSVEDGIRLTGAISPAGVPEIIFGILLGAAINNPAVGDIFLFPNPKQYFGDETEDDDEEDEENEADEGMNVGSNNFLEELLATEDYIRTTLGSPSTVIETPRLIISIMNLLPLVPENGALRLNVIRALHALVFACRRNQIILNQAGCLMVMLERLFLSHLGRAVSTSVTNGTTPSLPESAEVPLVIDIIRCLAEMGISTCEARFLFQKVQQVARLLGLDSQAVARPETLLPGLEQRADECFISLLQIALSAAKYSRWPSFIEFDTSITGYSGLNVILSDRVFPPVNNGYTFMAWLRVEQFDSKQPVSVLYVADPDMKCFEHIYIEPSPGHKLVCKTSVKHEVTFESFSFRENCWYHLALVHTRPRLSMGSCIMTMYVDGIMVEQLKCHYPGQHFPASRLRCVLGSSSELADKGTSSVLSWNLGSSYLLDDVIEAETANVIYNLGPRYVGNFQDQLDQFQTYEIIDGVNLDFVNKGNEKGVDLGHLAMLNAHVRNSNGQPLAEDRMYFSFFPANYRDEHSAEISGSVWSLLGTESFDDALTTGGILRGKVILNSAVPKVETALAAPYGVSHLAGNPVVVHPSTWADGVWKAGGCAIMLNFVEWSNTSAALTIAVAALAETVRFNPRVSEDMEKNHGYEILAHILQKKASLIRTEVVDIIMLMVGRPLRNPVEAILANPFAYCYLLLDFEVWRQVSSNIKIAFLSHYEDFLVLSRKRIFNMKRLSKLYPVKKMLAALKSEVFPEELLPQFIKAIKIVVQGNFTTEVIRTLATFIISTTGRGGKMRKGSSVSGKASPQLRRRYTVSSMKEISDQILDTAVVDAIPAVITDAKAEQLIRTPGLMVRTRNLVFELLLDILCDPNQASYVNKFTRTITSKWCLVFLEEHVNPYTVVLAMRLLARLLVSQGQNYVSRFRSADGFSVLERLLPFHWNLSQILQALVAILLGQDFTNLVMEEPFELSILGTNTKGDPSKLRVYCPEALHLLLKLVKQAVNVTVQHSVDLNSSEKVGFDANPYSALSKTALHQRSRSIGENVEEIPLQAPPGDSSIAGTLRIRLSVIMSMQQILVDFLSDLANHSSEIQDLFYKSETIDDIVCILFPVVCACEEVSIETELLSKDGALVLDSEVPLDLQAAVTLSRSQNPLEEEGITIAVPKAEVETASVPPTTEVPTQVARRMSRSSARVTSRQSFLLGASFDATDCVILKNSVMEAIMHLLVGLCVDSIVKHTTKPLLGLDAVLKSYPPSFKEHRIQFQSYVLKHVTTRLRNTLHLNRNLMLDPRVLGNVARYACLLVDTVYQAWLLNGADLSYDFLADILEAVQQLESQGVRRTARNDPIVLALYKQLNRIILYRLSLMEYETGKADAAAVVRSLDKLIYNQKIIFSPFNADVDFLKCVCHHLHKYLWHESNDVRAAAMSIWKLLLLQKPTEMTTILRAKVKGIEYRELVDGFAKLLEMELNSFISWMETRKEELNVIFQENISRVWENFLAFEQKTSKENVRMMQVKRETKLKRLYKRKALQTEQVEHCITKNTAWARSITEIEAIRSFKQTQDAMDNANFVAEEWTRLSSDLVRGRGIWDPLDDANIRWRLDFLEGRGRMRKKLQVNRYFFTQYPHMKNPSARDPLVAKSSLHAPGQCGSQLEPTVAAQTALLTPAMLSEDAASDSPVAAVDDKKEDALNISAAEAIQEPGLLSPVDGPASLISSSNVEQPTDVESLRDRQEDEEENAQEAEHAAADDDKNRKILRLLDHGDVVTEVYNVSRIMGLDACEGLLLLCRNNIYLIDNFFQRADGEVVEIGSVPQDERDQYLILLAAHAGSGKAAALGQSVHKHECRKCSFEDIKEIHKRRFLFRNVAMEIFLADGRNYLITMDLKNRDTVYNKLLARMSSTVTASESVAGTAAESESALASKISNLLGASALSELTQRWERREINNFQYLMYLNTLAGRSYNDLTQYPVFPWVLADYESDELNLSNPATFRDLSKPMGAQGAERAAIFVERFSSWEDPMGKVPPFHYGTHYSSAMIVCSFLIRLEPFTMQYLKLQGGHFDHADRLFHSIGKAWISASKENTSDVRELIPEFFYLPEFLENMNNFKFGIKQGTGEIIDQVILPPWAKGDPKLFIHRHRQALESEYVSAHLHEWIDLIFGYKQQGPQAVEAINVFHHLSYEGSVDIDAITDPVEKSATIGIINNFGQTPRQLFKKPHPPRGPEIMDASIYGYYRIHKHYNMLIQSMVPTKEIASAVGEIRIFNDKLFATGTQKAMTWPSSSRYVEWGFSDNSIRLFQTDSSKLLGIFENMHLDVVTCACFADEQTLVTGSVDTVVCVWRLKAGKIPEFCLQEVLRGHTGKVTCVATSKPWSLIVSGSEDHTSIIWDLNRAKYTRQLVGHECPVQCIAINDTTGDIVTCAGSIIQIWTINGELIISSSSTLNPEPVLCCTFYEGKNNEWIDELLLFTSHRKGIVKIWGCTVGSTLDTTENKKPVWALVLRHQLVHEDKSGTGCSETSDITAVYPSSTQRVVYTGDTLGRVCSWVLPDGSGDYHWMKDSSRDACMSCGLRFTVLERKHHCRTCGGIFCANCTDTPVVYSDKSTRWCGSCAKRLLLPTATLRPNPSSTKDKS